MRINHCYLHLRSTIYHLEIARPALPIPGRRAASLGRKCRQVGRLGLTGRPALCQTLRAELSSWKSRLSRAAECHRFGLVRETRSPRSRRRVENGLGYTPGASSLLGRGGGVVPPRSRKGLLEVGDLVVGNSLFTLVVTDVAELRLLVDFVHQGEQIGIVFLQFLARVPRPKLGCRMHGNKPGPPPPSIPRDR